ncbi:serine hydrolase domain-containing protein [Psychrobacillus sp. NPDC096389]|uniref:serine hydrolase domain-containing protein n=1 Tax=Psychrobacillus sp. NPDC096389 TaxID=3364490 RepID=UPI00381EB686
MSDLEKRLEEWIKAYSINGYLNGSILVAYKGEILVNKGFGKANWEHQVSNRPDTKYRIGSITKGFTAMAIYQLYEQKKLELDDPISKYLPYFPNGNNFTVYHCLTHTSGVANFTSFDEFWMKTMRLPSSLKETIDSFKNNALVFEAGTHFEYSNSGYLLLTAIIEVVSGKTYAEYLQEKIFSPLGMKNTGCDNGIDIVPDLAMGYSYNGKPIHSAYADLSFPLGAYGLYSTIEDLYIWDQAIQNSVLVSESATEKMLTPYLESYACGWSVSPTLGKKCFSHFGDISGYANDIIRFSEDQLTIIFLSNMNITPVSILTREIAKVIFNHNYVLPAPLEPRKVNDIPFISGRYICDKSENVFWELTKEGNEYFITLPKRYNVLYKFKLIPIEQGEKNIIFKTEMINELLEITYLNNIVQVVRYTDYENKTNQYKKVSDFS